MKAPTLFRPALVLAMLGAAPAFAQAPADSTSGCEVSPPTMERLSPRAQCYIRTYQRRCTPSGACMIRCIAEGTGQYIGGGCWHVCFAYGQLPWEEPSALRQCPAPGPGPQSPAPSLTCERGETVSPTLEVVVLADFDGAPIPGATVSVSTLPGSLQTDSLGRARIEPLPDGSSLIWVRARGFQFGGASPVGVTAGRRCQLIVRLAYHWDGGF
jgi:hypothetical protein